MAKEKRIRVILKEAMKAPKITEIENELKTFQNTVGGYIEVQELNPGSADRIDVILNEEGKIIGLPPNFRWVIDDFIVGTAVIASHDPTTGSFTSLNDNQIKIAMKHLEKHAVTGQFAPGFYVIGGNYGEKVE